MPRIRSIKPDLWADEALAGLPRDARLLFIGMFNFADDHGRMRGSPLLIRSQVFPYDSDVDVESLLVTLASPREASGGAKKQGFIQRYVVDGESFIWIRHFTRHQKIDHPSKPQFPEPPSVDTTDVAAADSSPREPSRALDESSRKISLEQGAGSREQGGEQGEQPSSAKPTGRLVPVADDAEMVFEEWRRVMGKTAAAKFTPERERRVKARLKDGYSVERLFRAIRGCRASPHHRGQNETGTVYDDLELICRDGTHVETFEGFAERGPAPPARGAANLQISPDLATQTPGRKFI